MAVCTAEKRSAITCRRGRARGARACVRCAGVTLCATGVRVRRQVHEHDVRGQAHSHNNTGMMCPYAGIIQIRYGRMQASLSAYLAVSSLLLE